MDTNVNSSQMWTSEEIKKLMEYATEMRIERDDAVSMLILTESKLKNEESKVKRLTNLIKHYEHNEGISTK